MNTTRIKTAETVRFHKKEENLPHLVERFFPDLEQVHQMFANHLLALHGATQRLDGERGRFVALRLGRERVRRGQFGHCGHASG